MPNEKRTLLDQWLTAPMPVVGDDYPAYEVPNHPAIRLVTGPKRSLLLGLGGVFLLCGLLMPGERSAAPNTQPDTLHPTLQSRHGQEAETWS